MTLGDLIRDEPSWRVAPASQGRCVPHETPQATRHLIHEEARPRMENARRDVTELLTAHGDQLVGLVSAQLGAETLDEVDAQAACARQPPVPLRSSSMSLGAATRDRQLQSSFEVRCCR